MNQYFNPDVRLYHSGNAPSLPEFLHGARSEVVISGVLFPRQLQDSQFREFIAEKMRQIRSLEVIMVNPEIDVQTQLYRILREQYIYIIGLDLREDLQKTRNAIDKLVETAGSLGSRCIVSVWGTELLHPYEIAIGDYSGGKMRIGLSTGGFLDIDRYPVLDVVSAQEETDAISFRYLRNLRDEGKKTLFIP